MSGGKWRKSVKKARTEYLKIGSIPCPAFGFDPIYFDHHGFTHMIRKGRNMRDIADTKRRFKLFRYVPLLIRNSRSATGYLESGSVRFWTLVGRIDGKDIKVVIRQIDSGLRHFYSVMD